MTYQHLKIKPIAGRIGAKILEIDLKQNLQDAIINEIRQALVQYKVIFFRDQNLNAQEQIAFAHRFGEITTAHPTVPSLAGNPYVTRPENTVRWRWKVGDVAFWDNRATQHYAIADYGNQSRRVQRVTIVGDTPVSIDGQKSQSVKGDASVYNKRIPVAV